MSAAAKSTTTQPEAATQMTVMNAPQGKSTQHQDCEHGKHQKKASRLRGGGGAKDCFLGLVGCFLCFECCEGCCECCADIICCPCEMCCEAAGDM